MRIIRLLDGDSIHECVFHTNQLISCQYMVRLGLNNILSVKFWMCKILKKLGVQENPDKETGWLHIDMASLENLLCCVAGTGFGIWNGSCSISGDVFVICSGIWKIFVR